MNLIKNAAPDFGKIKMNVDEVLHPRLLEYPAVADCFSTTNFTIFAGPPGSGKTNLLINFLNKLYKKVYHQIIIIMPEQSRKSVKEDNVFERIRPENIYDDLTMEVLDEVYEKIKDAANYEENTLLIVDDFQNLLKSKDIIKTLEKLVIKCRHLRTTIFLLQQNYNKLAQPIRLLAFNVVAFDVGKTQLLKLYTELSTIPKDKFDEITDFVFNAKYNFLILNNRSKKIYKNWDEIVLT